MDAVWKPGPIFGTPPRDAARTAQPPAPRPAPQGPVLITDCACPVDGATLLLALWRRWDADRDADDA